MQRIPATIDKKNCFVTNVLRTLIVKISISNIKSIAETERKKRQNDWPLALSIRFLGIQSTFNLLKLLYIITHILIIKKERKERYKSEVKI